MTRKYLTSSLLYVAILLVASACAAPKRVAQITSRPSVDERTAVEQPVVADAGNSESEDSDILNDPRAQPGAFDGGKMWTFDRPPLGFFKEEYDFSPDSTWFRHARLGALRFSTYCSASFVSEFGLIMSNHHCARASVKKVTRSGESLLDEGFIATDLADEREVEDLYVEQLVGMEDVTDQVYSAAEEVKGAGPKAEARKKRATAIENRMKSMAQANDSTLQVQVISLYDGGRYEAYTYKRFSNIKLVFAPELQIGYFGGDDDNFTYPRYNLDMSFFRAYDDDGNPLRTPDYFRWSKSGSAEGDLVFVVGNPGSTDRLTTVKQLEYIRDNELPQSIRVLRDRGEILRQYIESHPDEAEKYDLRNDYFSIQNTLKSQEGQERGLQEGILIARRGAAQKVLSDTIEKSDSLEALYGTVFDDIARIQTSKKASATKAGAFMHFLNPALSSRLLTRAMYGYVYTLLRQRGASSEQLEDIRKEATQIKSWPRDLERQVIAARLRDFYEALGAADPTIKRIVGDHTIGSLADSVATNSALADSSRFMNLLDENYLASGDVSVDLINSVAPLYFTLDQQLTNFKSREETFAARLARAQFAVYGETIPPDASFSLRIADGVVSGYAYNGTVAPAFTTFYGLMDQHYSHPGTIEWALPQRWITPIKALKYETQLNLVSTNDITGGNSGSPLLNKNLEIVGLVFDGNIESLPNQFLFTDTVARTVSVDSRGILEALHSVYDTDRIVEEIRQGRVFSTESAADKSVLVSEGGK